MKIVGVLIDFLFVFGAIHCFRLDGMWSQYRKQYDLPLQWQDWVYMVIAIVCYVISRETYRRYYHE